MASIFASGTEEKYWRMEIYRRYRCDFGHEWLVARGHEAVTCEKEIPAIA
jgi:hypothetical protein